MADIYPDDAHWSPPALMNERRQNYMSYPAQLAQWPQLNDDNAPKWPSGQPSQQSQFNVDNASNRPSRQFVQQPQFNVGDALKRTSSVQPAKPLESLGVSSGDAFKRSPPTQLAQQSQANVDSAPTWPRVKAYDPNKRRPLPQYEKPLEGLGPSALNPDTAPKRLPYIYDNVFARKKPPVDRKNPAVQPVQQPQVSAGVVLKGPPFEPVTRVEVTVDSILKRPKPAVQSVLRTQVGAGDVLERTPPAEPKKDHEASVAEAAEFWSSGSEPNQRLQALIDYANAPTAQAEANKPKNTLTATDTSRSDAGFHMLMSQMPQPSCTWREMAPVERSLVDDEITGKKWGVRTGGIGDGRLWMAKKDQHGNGPPSLWPRESEPKKNEPKKDDPKKLGH
ncbi:hypothetical protein B5807_03325 [Epicoccum nigrum]|uniref:Uncharacterized protein n=1 Tax=Epicoccum nigrum TaxID=105696 RepID=A0A1Y2M5X2_EPING|nr:hypothetical protein B5807_03325 [Epicoccum nigrum]